MQNLFIRKYSISKVLIAYFAAIIFLIAAIFAGISIGAVRVPAGDIFYMMGGKFLSGSRGYEPDPMYLNIVFNIRLPRVVLAGLVGASLAIAGAAFQGLLRNPLADPYTLGVSSGASVGAVFTLFYQLSLPGAGLYTLPLLSILSAFVTILIVISFARSVDRSMKVETIILTGIIFSSFLGALISLMIALSGEELRQIIGWLLGSVAMRGWSYVRIILPFLLAGSMVLLLNTRELNAIAFGEERAQYLGVNVAARKFAVLGAGSMITGAAVAVSGTIGFVGLVIPHLARLLWGPDHKHLLPLSMLVGAGFLILTDLTARTIIEPAELPIGVITALIGAPVFAYILLRRRKERSGG
ncbi:FecCD family ABC transporter permease [Siminovitchia sediminis]|uniref:FecCD family ABC transporter permease n=1 Tax=Siminovitchia sediminis TaxID=1274353 RepID=A0ABW4KKM1_9BACI